MRKKILIEQNLALFEKLQKAQLESNEQKKQIIELEKKLSELEKKLAENKERPQTEPLKRLEEKVISNASIKPDVEYGSKIIGEIVVLATQYSNSLTVGGDSSYRELVNLILGKTEVAKAEILNIVSGDESLEVKKARIDAIAAETREYFESVMAQKM